MRTFLWGVLLAVLAVLALYFLPPVSPKAQTARPPAPRAVAWDPLWAQNPEGIGSRPGDRRRLTKEQRLDILRAQQSDPERDPASDAELRREIERASR